MTDRKPPRSWSSPSLNESPSEKEGKFMGECERKAHRRPSMKVPPKRKGNPSSCLLMTSRSYPQ